MIDEKKVLTDGGKKLSYFYLNKSLCMSEKSSNFVPELALEQL